MKYFSVFFKSSSDTIFSKISLPELIFENVLAKTLVLLLSLSQGRVSIISLVSIFPLSQINFQYLSFTLDIISIFFVQGIKTPFLFFIALGIIAEDSISYITQLSVSNLVFGNNVICSSSLLYNITLPFALYLLF
jgi:hypothetical protein